jgi:general secretion pathway protein D
MLVFALFAAPAGAQPAPPASAPPAAIAPATVSVAPHATPEDAPTGTIVRGTQPTIRPPSAQRPYVARPGDVTLNFPATDVHEAAKAILGDILGLNYAVDAAVEGEVTVETAQPVAKEDVLPIFEQALKAANLGLVRRGRLYTIVPLADARRQSQLLAGTEAGYGTEAIVVRFVNVAELRKIIEPLVPEGAIAQSDTERNMLMVTGTAGERRAIRALVRQFDVNWLRGMSFALFIPQRSNAQTLIAELEQVVNAPGAPTKGLVRLVAIERLNGIVAISSQPQILNDVKRWITMLDRRDGDNERRLFVYRVQNGRAVDLANVIAVAFGGQARAAGAGQPASPGVPALSGAAPPAATTAPSAASTAFPASTMPLPTGPAAQAPAHAQTVSLGAAGRPVTITADETNNAIVVYGTARDYAVVEDALRKLDVVPLQVLIEVMVTEVTLNDGLQYGVQWFLTNGETRSVLSNTESAQPLPFFPGFNYFFNSGNGIRATLSALSSVTDVKVVSSPTLLVLNNHTAAIEVGDQVPIATQSAVSVDNPDAPIVNAIEYRDTGVILRVTPRVNDGGLVLLDISQEVSDVSATASSTINSPTVQQRRIASSVAIQDGRTIALGGLIRDNDTRTRGGIPYLKDIPLVGNLFSNTDNTHKRTELLVLLTPRIVRNAVDLQAITEELRGKIQTVEPLPQRRRR